MMASVERYLDEQRKQQSVSMAPWETKAIEKIRELEAENERLRKALEFYATLGNYAIETAECWEGTLLIEDSIANDDGGKHAREALQNE